tara:strand:- start:573 stop:869 length:297 start_codon:yes stop_codon:yes gene_type:complete
MIDSKTNTIETNVQTPNIHYSKNLLENQTEAGFEDLSINKQSFSVNPNKRGPHNMLGSEGFNEEGNFQQMFNQYTHDEDMKAQNSMLQVQYTESLEKL